MKITMTNQAINEINKNIHDFKEWYLVLKYDTEHLGCSSGIFNLVLTSKTPHESDQAIETNFQPVYVNKDVADYLDDQMTLDFNPSTLTYKLSSANQILNARMHLIKETDQ